MILTKKGFDTLRQGLGKLTQNQVDEINFIVSEFDKDKSVSYPQAAYMLATAWHETATRMLPIEEYGKGKNRTYGTWYRNSIGALYSFIDGSRRSAYLHNDYPYLYYGRGYVQLTWYFNYESASKKIGVDFLNNPDLVMSKKYAVKIMIQGMKDGWFTGKKLSDYINQSQKDYVGARRIINGTDKDKLISGYAETFEKALRSM